MNAKNVTADESEPTGTDADNSAVGDAVVSPAEAEAGTSGSATSEAAAVEAPAATSTSESASNSVASDDTNASASATGEVVAASAPVQTVYLTAPNPPKRKGNRGMGVLFTVLATVVFAAAYAGVSILLILFAQHAVSSKAIGQFISGPLFYVPVIVFLVIMILWALLANRASWWSWVIGSLVIAVVVYAASIGALLLVAGGFGLTAKHALQVTYGLASNPVIIASALLAREVAIWFGAAIAVRGRKVRERNYEAWEKFEREEAEKRAEFGGRAAV